MLSMRTYFGSVALTWPNLDKTKRGSEKRVPLCKEAHGIPETHPWGDCDFCQICLQLREKHQQKLKPQQDSIFSIILESKINGKTQGSSDV